MNIADKKIWQVAAGDNDRNYVDICLKFDVIIMGPGYLGPWPECISSLQKEGWTAKKVTDIKRFCEVIEDGHIVVLRLGASRVYGMGIVDGKYIWNDHFADIDGWDLQHVRRVKWLWKYDKEPKEFPAYSLKFGDTTQLMDSANVVKWIEELQISDELKERKLIDLPKSPEKPSDEVKISKISEFLFDKGIASSSIQALVQEIEELIRIAKWYQRANNKPSERETVAYLVVPLLRALGWTPQKMAVEWKNVDLALFSKLPREDDSNLSVVVEAKKKDMACLSALSQAQEYAKGRDNCQRLIVTDGLRYGVYIKNDKGAFPSFPNAYLNLTYMRSNYPILQNHNIDKENNLNGAKEAFLMMAADWTPTV